MNIILVSNSKNKKLLQPLISTWLDKGFKIFFEIVEGDALPGMQSLQQLALHADAIMMVVPAKKSPAAVVDGPLIIAGGKKVPVSLVPVANAQTLKNFVAASVTVHNRKPADQPITLLAQRMPRYLEVTKRIWNELNADAGVKHIFRWTSDVVFPGDMLYGINQGASVCLYLGHGRSTGWAGYYGVRLQHITAFQNKPSAAIFSLCCWTAGRKNVKHSFCESLVMSGITPFALGAVKPTLFTENTRWAIRFSDAIRSGVQTAGDLVKLSCPTQISCKHYRLFGDPTVPLLPDEHFIETAGKIKLYA